MAVNFCMGGNINSWALGSFSLEEYFLLKLSFPILMLVCNLALPGGFFPHDTRLQALVWEMISLDPRNREWCLYPES